MVGRKRSYIFYSRFNEKKLTPLTNDAVWCVASEADRMGARGVCIFIVPDLDDKGLGCWLWLCWCSTSTCRCCCCCCCWCCGCELEFVSVEFMVPFVIVCVKFWGCDWELVNRVLLFSSWRLVFLLFLLPSSLLVVFVIGLDAGGGGGGGDCGFVWDLGGDVSINRLVVVIFVSVFCCFVSLDFESFFDDDFSTFLTFQKNKK